MVVDRNEVNRVPRRVRLGPNKITPDQAAGAILDTVRGPSLEVSPRS